MYIFILYNWKKQYVKLGILKLFFIFKKFSNEGCQKGNIVVVKYEIIVNLFNYDLFMME